MSTDREPLGQRLKRAFDVVTGRYQPTGSKEQPVYGETAYADPFRLFGGAKRTWTPYNPSKLVSLKGLEVFDEMRRDDQVKAALLFKKQTVLSSGWDIKPPDGKEEDDEQTKYVRDTLEGLEGTFENALIQVMSALDYGYSVSEKVWVEDDGKVKLQALKTKRPHPFQFEIDAFGNLYSLQQTGNAKSLNPKKFLIYVYQGEFGNPYGTSDLDSAYRAWWTKNNSYKWLAMMLEKYGIPPIVAMYNSDAFKGGQLDRLKTVLEGMQASTVAIVPRNEKDDLEFFTPELAGQVSQCFVPAIDMMNRDIARAILMPGDLGYTPNEAGGSYAKAKVVFDVFLFAVEYLRTEIENAVNESIVKPIINLNYGGDSYPAFHFLPMTDDQQFAKLEQWQNMVRFGAVKGQADDEDHIREALDFPQRLNKLPEEAYLPPPPTGPFGEPAGGPGGQSASPGDKSPKQENTRQSQAGKLPSQSVSDSRRKAQVRDKQIKRGPK